MRRYYLVEDGMKQFADSPDVKEAKAQFNKAFKDAEEGKVGAQEFCQI
jgi:hypothetical protein